MTADSIVAMSQCENNNNKDNNNNNKDDRGISRLSFTRGACVVMMVGPVTTVDPQCVK